MEKPVYIQRDKCLCKRDTGQKAIKRDGPGVSGTSGQPTIEGSEIAMLHLNTIKLSAPENRKVCERENYFTKRSIA